MASKVFINLPVKDLERSKAFFAKLGYTFNEKFTDSSAACMVISEHIYSMLLSEARFKDFTPKTIVDATKSTEVLVALAVESKAKVDELADTALKAGATKTLEPQDHGFMYERSFNDLDGHIWEIFWMDPAAVQ
jgi:predicted lactoylglutathione lyase